MPVLGSTAYPTARQALVRVRALLNDANINANAPVLIAGISRNANVVQVTTIGPHGLIGGSQPDQITVAQVVYAGATSFNGVFNVVTVLNAQQFTYAQNGENGAGTNQTGSVSNIGQGAVWTDFVLIPYLNQAYGKVRRGVSNVGQESMVRDDVLLVVTALANPDPSAVVAITDATAPPNQLPVDLIEPLKIWERPNGSAQDFQEMSDMTRKGGLPSRFQEQVLGVWEWRGDGIYFIGALQDTQIRLRYRASFLDLADGTSTIQIRDSVDCLALLTAAFAGASRGSPLAEKWDIAGMAALEDLIVASARKGQRQGTRRRPFSARSGWTPF